MDSRKRPPKPGEVLLTALLMLLWWGFFVWYIFEWLVH